MVFSKILIPVLSLMFATGENAWAAGITANAIKLFEVRNSPHDPNDPSTPLAAHFEALSFTVWVGTDNKPRVEKRTLGKLDAWDYLDPNFLANPDAHNRFSIAIDKTGYLHVLGNMHNHTTATVSSIYKNVPILYWRSKQPFTASGTSVPSTYPYTYTSFPGAVQPGALGGFQFLGASNSEWNPTGSEWTAPLGTGFNSSTGRFFKDNGGELYYTCQVQAVYINGPGKVGLGLWKYNTSTKRWRTLGATPPGVANTQSRVLFWEDTGWYSGGSPTPWFQNYQARFSFDKNNTMHFVVAANTDMTFTLGANKVLYARSYDGGVTWQRANGSSLSLPIRGKGLNSADVPFQANDKNALFGPIVGVVVDVNGVVGVGSQYISGTSVAQQWVTWEGNNWNLKTAYSWGKKIEYAFLDNANNLVFQGEGLQVSKSFSSTPITLTLPSSMANQEVFALEEYELRKLGKTHFQLYDRATRTQSVIFLVVPKP